MKWTYKNIQIGINVNGEFCFMYRNFPYYYNSLKEAEEAIDKMESIYYHITSADIKRISSKHDGRDLDIIYEALCALQDAQHGEIWYSDFNFADDALENF